MLQFKPIGVWLWCCFSSGLITAQLGTKGKAGWNQSDTHRSVFDRHLSLVLCMMRSGRRVIFGWRVWRLRIRLVWIVGTNQPLKVIMRVGGEWPCRGVVNLKPIWRLISHVPAFERPKEASLLRPIFVLMKRWVVSPVVSFGFVSEVGEVCCCSRVFVEFSWEFFKSNHCRGSFLTNVVIAWFRRPLKRCDLRFVWVWIRGLPACV